MECLVEQKGSHFDIGAQGERFGRLTGGQWCGAFASGDASAEVQHLFLRLRPGTWCTGRAGFLESSMSALKICGREGDCKHNS